MEKLLLLLVISIVYFLLLTILILYHPYKEKIYKNQNSIEYKILRELKETNKKRNIIFEIIKEINMLFIGGPLNKQYIKLNQNSHKYIHVQSSYDLSGFDITNYINHYYQKEKIKGQKQTFYIMRYTEITIDKMLQLLINGE